MRVMRVEGGLGESLSQATQPSASSRRGWPGKREQVWPSGLKIAQEVSLAPSFLVGATVESPGAPNTQENEVEARERNRVRADKGSDHLLLVVVRHGLGIIEKSFVDRVDVLSGDGDLGEEVLVDGGVVGVGVVERDDSLVRKEDLPVTTIALLAPPVPLEAQVPVAPTHHLSHLTSGRPIRS